MAVVSDNQAQLLDLPFDQYSRQFVVAHLIDATLRKNKRDKFAIIDLGGHKGKTKEFLPQDTVTVLDVFDESYPGYVKGDATAMTFADNTFDIATSFDVLEHIPRESRQSFINEALRVSKLGIFIAVPIDADKAAVSGAEQLLNDVFKELYKEDHPWLKEHIDYRIPTDAEIMELAKQSGALATSLQSNQITDWQLLQLLNFLAARNPHNTEPAKKLNRWYNEHIAELELGVNPGYRRVYFMTKDRSVYNVMSKEIEKLEKPTKGHRYLQVHESTLAQTLKALAAVGASFAETAAQNNSNQHHRTVAEERVAALENENKQLLKELEDIRQSVSWRVTRPLRAVKKRLSS